MKKKTAPPESVVTNELFEMKAGENAKKSNDHTEKLIPPMELAQKPMTAARRIVQTRREKKREELSIFSASRVFL